MKTGVGIDSPDDIELRIQQSLLGVIRTGTTDSTVNDELNKQRMVDSQRLKLVWKKFFVAIA